MNPTNHLVARKDLVLLNRHLRLVKFRKLQYSPQNFGYITEIPHDFDSMHIYLIYLQILTESLNNEYKISVNQL